MSVQDDIFDLESNLNNIPSRIARQEAKACFRRIIDRLSQAEMHEERYGDIVKAMSTLRYYLLADPKGSP